MSERPPNTPELERLLAGLGFEASVAQRVQALVALGLTRAQIADALGVSSETLRQWQKGDGAVRPSNRQLLDELRYAALLLVDAHGDAAAAHRWLMSRHAPDAPRPIELFPERAEAVVAAAAAHVDGNDPVAVEILADARDTLAAARTGHAHPNRNDARVADVVEPTDTEVAIKLAREIVDGHLTLAEIEQRLREAADFLTRRPNYSELERVVRRLEEALPSGLAATCAMADSLKAENEAAKAGFEELGRGCIAEGARILVYALSWNVATFLGGATEPAQTGSRLYVAEGRSKAGLLRDPATAFADAKRVLQLLSHTKYTPAVMLDSDAVSLLTQAQELDEDDRLTHVILGAQSFRVGEDGTPTQFINTAGTAALVRAAYDRGVRVWVITRSSKLGEARGATVVKFEPPIRDDEQSPWSNGDSGNGNSALVARAKLIRVKSELCDFLPNVTLYTESGPVDVDTTDPSRAKS